VQQARLEDRGPGGPRVHRKAAGLFIILLMTAMAFSLWTVIPLGWIWVGSRLSNTQAPSTGPYAVTFFGIVTSIVIVVWLLAWLNRLFARVTGSHELSLDRVRLYRSLSDERKPTRRWNVMEAVILISVLGAGATMFVWFLFVAGSPLPSQ
jgi:hypothetical protein